MQCFMDFLIALPSFYWPRENIPNTNYYLYFCRLKSY